MNFELSPELEELSRRTQGFCDTHLAPDAVTALESSGEFPAALYGAMVREGLLGACLPAAAGGGGAGVTGAVAITEALARHSATAANLFLVNAVFAGTTLLAGGSDAQRGRFLPQLAAGTRRFAFALTEPQAGSDAGSIEATAARRGEELVINGTKLYTTGASVADYILTVVRTSPEVKASRGSSIILVPTDAEGLEIRPLDKIAGNAFPSCEVVYRDVHVALELLLGGEEGLGQAWDTLRVTGAMERICVAASSLGLATTVFSLAREHALQREQFGQPIARFQAIQHALAEMATEIEAMRWLTWSAAWKMERGEDAGREISMAKYYCSEKANALALRGMQLLGGSAYLEDVPMARYLREGMLAYYAGGTNEIQKNLIARYLGL